MRYISKKQTPDCLKEFIKTQQEIKPEPVNLTYKDFRDKKLLMRILTNEQFGLCGYTGAPIDEERISKLQTPAKYIVFSNHIEHLRSQNLCRQDLKESGGTIGRNAARDLDYMNLIAALEIRGAESEQFGAVIKKDRMPPVLPTEINCTQRFCFLEDGNVIGKDASADEFIKLLLLNHDTLLGWRRQAIKVWLDPEVVNSLDDFKNVLAALTTPKDGTLPEFAFAIEAVAKSYFNETNI